MKIACWAILMLAVGVGRVFPADAPPPAPASTPDPLTEALPILEKSYADFSELNYKPGDHLADLISRSGGRIDLLAPESTAPLPIATDSLADGTLYLRLDSFAPPAGKTWVDLAAQIQKASGSAPGIVLDVRSNATPDDYQGAIRLLEFFAPKSAGPSKFLAPIIVLTNGRTSGAAEAFAQYLQADGALVVGRPTAGRFGTFQDAKLSSGEILRFAVQPRPEDNPAAAFTFGTAVPKWDHPVIPDIALNVDEHSEKAALTLIGDNHVDDVIGEAPERHRMSEAALLLNQDPEYDAYLSSLKERPMLLSLPVIHDTALITALDSLKAIRVSQPPAPTAASTNAPPGGTSLQ